MKSRNVDAFIVKSTNYPKKLEYTDFNSLGNENVRVYMYSHYKQARGLLKIAKRGSGRKSESWVFRRHTHAKNNL